VKAQSVDRLVQVKFRDKDQRNWKDNISGKYLRKEETVAKVVTALASATLRGSNPIEPIILTGGGRS